MPVRFDYLDQEPELQIILLDGIDLSLSHKVILKAASLSPMEFDLVIKTVMYYRNWLALQLWM